MNILFLCHKMPFPPTDGGAIATLSMIQGFASKGDHVVVLSMQTYKHNTKISDLPVPLKQQVSWHQIWVDTRIKPLKLLLNLLGSKKPYNAERFRSVKFKQKLIDLLQNQTFDLIQLEGLYLAPYLDAIRAHSKAVVALRAHNVEHEIWQRLAFTTKPKVKKYYITLLANRIKRLEFETLQHIDLLIPITHRDANQLNKNQSLAQFVCPTGINPDKIQLSTPKFEKTIFYIGALDWEPNQEGILWFLKEIWQELSVKFPDWQFVLAGRNAPKAFENQMLKYRLSYLGEVKSAEAFIDAHNLMVVPLFTGSGMRIKLIEGMARGKCIVTTSIGAEGIPVQSGNNLFLADDAPAFKKHLEFLLTNTDTIAQIGKNACSFVQGEFNNERLIDGLRNFYQSKLKS